MLARLKRRLPDAADEALLADLLSEAAAFIRAYTRREVVPDELEDAVVRCFRRDIPLRWQMIRGNGARAALYAEQDRSSGRR